MQRASYQAGHEGCGVQKTWSAKSLTHLEWPSEADMSTRVALGGSWKVWYAKGLGLPSSYPPKVTARGDVNTLMLLWNRVTRLSSH